MDRCSAVKAGSDQGEFVGDLSMLGENLREEHSGSFGRDGLERTPDLGWCVGFDVEGIDVAWGTEVEDHDRRALGLSWVDRLRVCGGQVLRQA
jgi:hypothetical protein